MERGTKTTINQLGIGDRFYKANDKKKEVWEVVQNERKVTKFQTYDYWIKKDTDNYPVAIKSNSAVIFLRSATE